MTQFRKTINGIDFHFEAFIEGRDEICRVQAENQNFKMTIAENGLWIIRQQVPGWIKVLEPQLGKAIDETSRKKVG